MKKVLVLALVVCLTVPGLMVPGCALIQTPCSKAGQLQLTNAETVLTGIQTYYTPLQALVAAIPVAGSIIAASAPIALAAADVALKNLGTIIASGCANDAQVTLAQIVLTDIQNLFKTAAVQKAMATPAVQLKMIMLNSGK